MVGCILVWASVGHRTARMARGREIEEPPPHEHEYSAREAPIRVPHPPRGTTFVCCGYAEPRSRAWQFRTYPLGRVARFDQTTPTAQLESRQRFRSK